MALTTREIGWLTPEEQAAFSKDHDAAKYRKNLAEKGLPPEFQGGYGDLVKRPNAHKIEAFLLTVVELTESELKDLEKITKGREPAGFTVRVNNARIDYQDEMTPYLHGGKASHTKPGDCRKAYEISSKYRGLLAKAGYKTSAPGAAPAGGASGAASGGTSASETAPLVDKELAVLTPAEKASYQTELKAAGKDAAKIGSVNWKYRRVAASRDVKVFNGLDSGAKKDLCAPYKDYVVGGGGPAGSRGEECSPQAVATQTKSCMKKKGEQRSLCVAALEDHCRASQARPTATPSSAALPALSAEVKAACVGINNSTAPPSDGKKTSVVPSKPGEDKGADEKKGFFASLSKPISASAKAGMAGAFVGVLGASLFFGPGGALVAGAAVGAVAFFGWNLLNSKLP